MEKSLMKLIYNFSLTNIAWSQIKMKLKLKKNLSRIAISSIASFLVSIKFQIQYFE